MLPSSISIPKSPSLLLHSNITQQSIHMTTYPHKYERLGPRLLRLRQVHVHLITVEISVVWCTYALVEPIEDQMVSAITNMSFRYY